MTDSNQFRRLWNAGYKRLVPIAPPGCDVSPYSSLARPERQKDLGKAPGELGPHGWRGLAGWETYEATEADLDRWHAWGAGVGIKTGQGLIGIDIDCMDATLADVCARTATEVLGASENRVGRAPKRLKMYRVTEAVPYQDIIFDGGHVEVLSEGRQFVAAGVHPVTGKPYEWPRGVPRYDALPIITAQQISEYVAKIIQRLPAAKVKTSSLPADRKVADPAQLTGRADDVRRAVAALPNTTALFPTYASYIEVAQAIKGALPDDDETGLELFQEWASRWEDGNNDPDRVASDWRRCKPSHSLGAQYLFSLAEAHGAGDFTSAEAWFTAVPPGQEIGLNPFETADGAESKSELPPIAWTETADAWSGDPPPREWLVEGLIPKGQVTLLYGEGGIGKTLLIHQYAICAAAGLPWLGQKTCQARVMLFLCEDDHNELWLRHHEICKALGVDPASIRGRLAVAVREGEENILAGWDQGQRRMVRTPLWSALRADVAAFRADVLIADTLVDVFSGDEINRSQANAFVKTGLRPLAPTVVALGHPSVGGRAEGRSGSTGWSNAARSRLYLRRPKGVEKGDARELEIMKTNRSSVGARIQLKWTRGHFKAEADLNTLKSSLPNIADTTQKAVLEALDRAEQDKVPLTLSPRSPTYAPRVLKRIYDMDSLRAEDIEEAIIALERAGQVRVATWRTDKRNLVTGYNVIRGGALD